MGSQVRALLFPPNMALWCSRLARQPVTLEVDGSSPFGVAKKRSRLLAASFFAITDRTRRIKLQQSGGLLLPPVQTLVATFIFVHSRTKMETSPFGDFAGRRVRNAAPCEIENTPPNQVVCFVFLLLGEHAHAGGIGG